MHVSALALRTRFSSEGVFANHMAPAHRTTDELTSRRSTTIAAKPKRAVLSWRITREPSSSVASMTVRRPLGMRRTAMRKLTESLRSAPMFRSQMQSASMHSATPVVNPPTSTWVYASVVFSASICASPTCKDPSFAHMADASDVRRMRFAVSMCWAEPSRNLSMSSGLSELPLTKVHGVSSRTWRNVITAKTFNRISRHMRKNPAWPLRPPCPITRQLSHTLALHSRTSSASITVMSSILASCACLASCVSSVCAGPSGLIWTTAASPGSVAFSLVVDCRSEPFASRRATRAVSLSNSAVKALNSSSREGDCPEARPDMNECSIPGEVPP
mmetsp:Transcript_91450/g.222075  ORF Transcript_91450/g.222075 Transcript_91450/m.222075 type:complete len:331 (+) Transcript_91450:1186-2178(+)